MGLENTYLLSVAACAVLYFLFYFFYYFSHWIFFAFLLCVLQLHIEGQKCVGDTV